MVLKSKQMKMGFGNVNGGLIMGSCKENNFV